MSRYQNVKVSVSEKQKDKIKRAVQAGSPVSIRLSHDDLAEEQAGVHVLALTQAQINKMKKAYQNGKGVTIKMSKTQLEHNTKIEGGFLQFLLPLLATAGRFLASSVLPSLATGALSGIGSAAGSKIVDKISGNGVGSGIVYVKKDGKGCKLIPEGQGLFLAPWNKGRSVTADGLYMKTAAGYSDGRGLLLGPNSPFKDFPILGMIL